MTNDQCCKSSQSCTPSSPTSSSCGGDQQKGKVQQEVQEYYGQTLQNKEDLKTNACKTSSAPPKAIRKILGSLHDEVIEKYYGCGLTIPKDFSNLKGLRVLDLGSGSGRDCYLLSKLVGRDGYVVGVDMTDEQLAVANKHIDYHTAQFGYDKPNVKFLKGYLEKLDELDLEEGSFDIIVSNCVLNLSTEKEKVLKSVFRLLKEGGEFYFSDVYSDRRVPKKLADDAVVWGECLGGALYWNDFITFSKRVGFVDPRLVEQSPVTVDNKNIENRAGNLKFFSATYRLFKLSGLEAGSEDYGQAVAYNGKICSLPTSFVLDKEHQFEVGKVIPVCENTKMMLKNTRLSKYFDVFGDGNTHFGIFEAPTASTPVLSSSSSPSSSSSCDTDAPSSSGGCC